MGTAGLFPLSVTERHIVNSVRPVWITDLEDLKKTVSRCLHCGSLGLQHKAHTRTSIDARIKRCRRLRAQACAQAELEAWRGEEKGLRDALLERDHTHQYRDRPPAVFERYAMGVEDGNALIRLACMEAQRTTISSQRKAMQRSYPERGTHETSNTGRWDEDHSLSHPRISIRLLQGRKSW